MKNIKKILSTLIPACLGIVALVLVFILDGAIITSTTDAIITTITTTTTVSLIGLIFGSPVLVSTIGDTTTTTDIYTGGMSIFGIVSFVLLILGIVITGYSYSKKKAKMIKLVGNIALVASGILMFFVLMTGTDVIASIGEGVTLTKSTKFVEFYEGYKLAMGSIIYAILTIVGGGIGLLVTINE